MQNVIVSTKTSHKKIKLSEKILKILVKNNSQTVMDLFEKIHDKKFELKSKKDKSDYDAISVNISRMKKNRTVQIHPHGT